MAHAHIVGAGLAGLSCALRLVQAGYLVSVYEATGHAGGRCRSFFDEKFGRVIDNGNHLLMNGNTNALAYLDALRSNRLWTSLTQAQRDLFGAHTYRRIDREGRFHTKWPDTD